MIRSALLMILIDLSLKDFTHSALNSSTFDIWKSEDESVKPIRPCSERPFRPQNTEDESAFEMR